MDFIILILLALPAGVATFLLLKRRIDDCPP